MQCPDKGNEEFCFIWHLCRDKSCRRRKVLAHTEHENENEARSEGRFLRLQLWRRNPARDLKQRLQDEQWLWQQDRVSSLVRPLSVDDLPPVDLLLVATVRCGG